MALYERFQPLDDILDTTIQRVANWTTSKRRKARAEDHTGVQEITVVDNVVIETRHRLIDHGEDEAVAEIGIRSREVLSLDGPILLEGIKAPAGLGTEVPGLNHLLETVWCLNAERVF